MQGPVALCVWRSLSKSCRLEALSLKVPILPGLFCFQFQPLFVIVFFFFALFSFFRFFRYLLCPPTSWCLETEPAQILRRHSAMRSRGTPKPLILECSWVLIIGYKSGSVPIVALVAPETQSYLHTLRALKVAPRCSVGSARAWQLPWRHWRVWWAQTTPGLSTRNVPVKMDISQQEV